MRAAILTEINTPLQIVDLEQEPPRDDEVRVHVKAAGVCMSDWHIVNGDWPLPLPMVLEHEAAGIVAETGPGVTGVKPGDHVIFSFGRIAAAAATAPRAERYCASAITIHRAGGCMTARRG